MEFSLSDGWLAPVRRLLSPNRDERPTGCGIDLLVVHGISLPPREYGETRWIDALFTNTLDPRAHPYFSGIHDKRVSAHALIGRDGFVTQYVPFDQRAWHAGLSAFQGRTACNDFSIGIELEGSDDDTYEQIQYEILGDIARVLMRHYPGIKRGHIVGHSDIAPGRKTDPGPHFDWNRLYTLLDRADRRPA
ncbi:MAG: 1,6-anhydro-N-acetylmuramyl-L-alanine amidase AmpD [Gammaproteobacteria bacterium]|nr:1,6-anhydro-N-acetylmuramyl-L-alanine amidase AmpD [Gammaproteobacteria bacterium]